MQQLSTKRTVLAQLSVCVGCCCGNVARGKPEVPLKWLKEEWRQRGLAKHVQLTISGCLGPCDLSNIVSISCAAGTVWLGALQEFRNYAALLEWALASKDAGHPLPLPTELSKFCFNPFRSPDFSSPLI